MLEVSEVSKTYPGESLGAVNHVSFYVEPGEIISIIGKSGSGKTTLLRMLAGLMRPDTGRLTYNGEDFQNPNDQLIAGHSSIKMVFQDYALMPNMTVEENIGYPLLGMVEEEKRSKIGQLVELCKLDGLEKKTPKLLSGGQQQRLSLARALAEEPEVLLMDEPFSNIDPISKQTLLLEILEISRQLKIGVVFVTHDTKDAMLISDRIAFMNDGKLIQIDTPEEIYKSPLSLEIARFLGFVNEFSSIELAELGWFQSSKKFETLVIKAEHIGVTDSSDIELEIIESRFLGKDFLNKGIAKSGKEVLFFSSKKLKEGEKYGVEFSSSDFLYF